MWPLQATCAALSLLHLSGGTAMTYERQDLSIAGILDDAIANPHRLRELKRALRARSEALDLAGPSSRRTFPDRADAPSLPVNDQCDDSLWDNMPV